MQLTRESIITAAIEILDEYGLGDMTMRRLAKHLKVVPGALYWHIPNKQSLIEAIAAQILAPVLDTAGVEKQSALELCARLRATMIAHRDGAEVVSAALPVGTMAQQLIDALNATDTLSKMPPDTSQTVAITLLNFIMGATMHEQSTKQLQAAIGAQAAAESSYEKQFHAGLELILAGVSVLG
ncbi:TetR family transcriptional regulator [Corynebacterium sp. H128]|uniref:TetR family transcriptional regulator n=1 Tax=unclassified Corynebacterium TaxID=2624378 RepID=UPI0030B77D5F